MSLRVQTDTRTLHWSVKDADASSAAGGAARSCSCQREFPANVRLISKTIPPNAQTPCGIACCRLASRASWAPSRSGCGGEQQPHDRATHGSRRTEAQPACEADDFSTIIGNPDCTPAMAARLSAHPFALGFAPSLNSEEGCNCSSKYNSVSQSM